MPGNPDIRPADVHIDVALQNLAIDWPVPELIGERLAPFTEVEKQSDKYYIYGRAEERITPARRGLTDPSKSVEFGLSTDTFYIDDYALNNPVPGKTRKQADPGAAKILDRGRITQKLKTDVMLNHESQVKTLLSTSGNYLSSGGPNSTGLYENLDTVAAHNFDDSGQDGLKYLLAYIEFIEKSSQIRPDTIVLSADTWRLIKTDPSFKAIAAQNVVLSKEAFAELIEVPNVIIAKTAYNTAKKGQSPSIDWLWPSNCIWLLTVGQAGPMWPSTVKTFTTNLHDYYSNGQAVRAWTDPVPGGGVDYIEYARAWGLKATGINESSKIITGAFLENVYIAL